MPRGILVVVVAIELAVFMGSMVFWSFALARKSQGMPFYPYGPRRPVPWGLFDLGLLAFVAMLAVVIVGTLARSLLGIGVNGELTEMVPYQYALLILADSTVSLGVIASAILFLRWRVRAGLHDFGIEPAKVDSDVGMGMIAFVMLSVPVFMIQIALTTLFPTQDQHPLIDMLKADSSPKLVLVAILVAVVVAPFVEEYFFRVLLQGWLENVACRLGDLHGILFGGYPATDPDVAKPLDAGLPEESRPVTGIDPTEAEAAPGLPVTPDWQDGDQASPSAGATDNPYASPQSPVTAAQEELQVADGGRPLRPRHWPIFVSAGIFAAMHLGHGYDPIPLFVLAVGLGYLYQQTHRIIPCIVVHLLLNATSIAALWLSITFGGNG